MDPRTAQGVGRMFPGTFGGQARVATPIDVPRRRGPAVLRSPVVVDYCLTYIGDGPVTSNVYAAMNADGTIIWQYTTEDSNRKVYALNVPSLTTADSFDIPDFLDYIIGGNAAGDMLYTTFDGMDGGGNFIYTLHKRTTGGSVTDLTTFTNYDPAYQIAYDPETDSVGYMLATTGTDYDVFECDMSGTVTNLGTITTVDHRTAGPIIGPGSRFWFFDYDGVSAGIVSSWTVTGGLVSTVGLDPNASFGPLAVYSDGSILVHDNSTTAYVVHPDMTYDALSCPSILFSSANHYGSSTTGFTKSMFVAGSGSYNLTN